MPNLGPGVDQSLSATVTPTLVFTPIPGQQSSIRLYNIGSSNPVYVGGAAVTQFNGIPVYPGNAPVEFQNMPTNIYVAAGLTRGAAAGTLSAAATTAGTTALTLTTAVPAGLAAGTFVMVGSTVNTSNTDVNVVASTTASSAITFVSPMLYDHAASTVVYAATLNGANMRVTAGLG